MIITEPDVTLTDYALTAECAIFVYFIYRYSINPLQRWFLLFFGSLSLASLMGGTVHGFFLDENSPGYKVLWPATLISIGLTALSAWNIGARILFSERAARYVLIVTTILFAAYSMIVLSLSQTFLVAITHYLPSTMFLLIAFLILYHRKRAHEIFIGILGLGMTFLAPVIQQKGISIHPIYFNHNAFYHVVQGISLFMIFWSARWMIEQQAKERNLP